MEKTGSVKIKRKNGNLFITILILLEKFWKRKCVERRCHKIALC